MTTSKVSTGPYYATYNGHEVQYLGKLLDHQRVNCGKKRTIFLAGDSSLDNKYWFHNTSQAINGFEEVLNPPTMKQDICYWLNREAVERGQSDLFCLSTAVEATSLNSRAFGLLEQDKLIRQTITEDDTLIVSVGGNDIALTPVLFTALNISALVCCTPQLCIEKCACAYPPNLHLDCGCLGCGLPGCIAGLVGWPIGIGYFVDMFKNRVGNYIKKLVHNRKPKKVIVCMIYNPDEKGTGWADAALGAMFYNQNPGKLQACIKKIFELGTAKIRIPGTEVVPFPLFEVLDGKDSDDYVARVEPSPQGGKKMAKALMDAVLSSRTVSHPSSHRASRDL